MKRLRFLITTIALAAVLTSCGGDNNNNNNATQTQSPTANPTQTEGVMDDLGDAAKDVTNGVGEGVKNVGDAVKNTTK